MKNNFILILITFVLYGLLSCNQSTVVDIQNAKDDNSLLWKIEKEGQPTSYLFGTMHMIEKEYYDFSSNLESIIKSSDAIIMEISGMPNPIKAMMLLKLKKGELKDLFTDEEFKTILAFLKEELDVSESNYMATYNTMKPFFLLQSITQAYFSDDAESYDLNIMQSAKNNKKPIIGLETIAEQIAFFDVIPNKEMAGLLMESIQNFEGDKKEFLALQKLYSDQDIQNLIPFMEKQSPELMKYKDVLLTNRNQKWIPKLDKELKSKSCFIAVGAAHLFDKKGIISLLKQEGYTLSPIVK